MTRCTIDDADNESGDVVLAVGVEPRHLRRLSTEQRTPILATGSRHARDNLLGDVGRKPPGSKVVEKEQRLGALHEDVVDAVIHQVGTDGVVPAGHECNFELGADAVSARDEHRIGHARQVEPEQPAEGADVRQHALRERRTRQSADAPDCLVARIDVYTGRLVVHVSISPSGCAMERYAASPGAARDGSSSSSSSAVASAPAVGAGSLSASCRYAASSRGNATGYTPV